MTITRPPRFAPDLALLLLSWALPIVALAGSHVLTILLVGAIASHIFDCTNQRGPTLAAARATVAAAWVAPCNRRRGCKC